MTKDDERNERVTWLHYEFAETIERYERREIDARKLAAISSELTSSEEIEQLDDELLRHTFWAMQHVLHRPACWAPTPDELDYVLRCLRDEEVYDPEQVEFTYRPSA